MYDTISIKFVDGEIQDSKALTATKDSLNNSFSYNKWTFEGRKKKIVCIYKDEKIKIKYQVFSNGFYKLAKVNSLGKWITLNSGFLRKGKSKKFSGFIILPTENALTKISCLLL